MDRDALVKLKGYFEEMYSTLRKQQKTEITYYKDTFPVPWIKEPYRVVRTGLGSRLIDAPAEHIITKNPQVFYNSGNKERNERVSKVVNQTWIPAIKRQIPNPPKGFVKNELLYGESYLKILHNESWVTKKKVKEGLPVHFIIPDPMTIYTDQPESNGNPIPKRVLVWCERLPSIIKRLYPNWQRPTAIDDKSKVEWLEYWDEDQRLFVADEITVLDTSNLYGFVPFIRQLSGFGTGSPEGDLIDIVVGRLRNALNLIEERTTFKSDFNSMFHLFGMPKVDAVHTVPTAQTAPDWADNYDMGAGAFNDIPYGIEIKDGVRQLPGQEWLAYLDRLEREIERESPTVLSGIPVGASGRQQDMAGVSAMTRYESIVESTEYAFSKGIGLATQIIEKIPTLIDDTGFKDDDFDSKSEFTVTLKATDPIEEERKKTMGSRLYQSGEIDLMTNLTEYQGYTQDKAQEIMTNIMIDGVTFRDPIFRQIIGVTLAEEAGFEKQLAEVKMQGQQLQAQQSALAEQPSNTQTQRGQGEVQTPTGQEQIDMSLQNKGMRQPPSNFNRGGGQ